MKHSRIPAFLMILLAGLALACASSAPASAPVAPAATNPPAATNTPAATPDSQATVEAAIAATSQAQSSLSATVNAAVQSTVIAMPPTATPVPPVDETSLSQEEMEALIDQAVNEAVAASTQASAAADQAAADEAVTGEEAQTVQVYVEGADQAIAYAYELLEVYGAVYGELAGSAMQQAQQTEQELEAMAASIEALNATLQQINTTLQQGQAIATETITQLEAAAAAASASLAQIQAHSQALAQQAQSNRDQLAAQVAGIQPDAVPGDLQATLQSAFSFLDQVRGLTEGGQKPNPQQILALAQLGANVSAGLNQHGGPKLQGLSGKFGELSLQMGRGQFPQAHGNLGGLETSLGSRPAGGPGSGGPGIRP